MKKITLLLGLSLALGQLIAQEDKAIDPLRNFKTFYELGATIEGTRVNTEYTHFSTSNGDYDFRKNNYLPTLSANINFGWLINDKENNTIWTIKTGINVNDKAANLLDSSGNKLQLTTSYVQVPLMIGFRQPIQYAKNDSHFFHAYEVNFGAYAATPLYQKLDNKNNIDAEGKTLSANYLKFGLIWEIAFSAFDKKGHGHKFGLRVTQEFTKVHKFKKTPSELYPFYTTVGIFYNIINDYD